MVQTCSSKTNVVRQLEIELKNTQNVKKSCRNRRNTLPACYSCAVGQSEESLDLRVLKEFTNYPYHLAYNAFYFKKVFFVGMTKTMLQMLLIQASLSHPMFNSNRRSKSAIPNRLSLSS